MENDEQHRFCKDCRHSYRVSAFTAPTIYYCDRFVSYDPVYGRTVKTCSWLRDHGHPCGPEGKQWVKKPTMVQRFKGWLGWMG